MAVEGYDNRFTTSVLKLGHRFLEEMGMVDIYDELADFTDEDMSFLDRFQNLGSLGWQVFNAPVNTAAYMAIEANRALGAQALGAMDNPTSLLRNLNPVAALGQIGDIGKPGNAFFNYANAWIPPNEMPEDEEDPMYGAYTAATLGDLILVGQDRVWGAMEGLKTPGFVRPTIYGVNYLGLIGQPRGTGPNGSYIKPTFDIHDIGAGAQMRDSYLRTAQMISNVTTEAAVDPLNLLAPMLGASIKARQIIRISDAGVRGTAATVGMADTVVTPAGIVEAAEDAKVMLRASQTPPGIGMINQQGLLDALKPGGDLRRMATWLTAPERTKSELVSFYSNPGLIAKDALTSSDEAAGAMAELTSFFSNRPDDLYHVLNAGATRNAQSIDVIKEAVKDNTPLLNMVDTLFDTGDNMFERLVVEFGNGTIMPDGHDFQMAANDFLKLALKSDPAVQTKWDELIEAGKFSEEEFIRQFGRRAQANTVIDRTFTNAERADALLDYVPGSKRALEKTIKRAEPEWLTSNSTLAHYLPGGSHRFMPSFLFLSKPGLQFKLHGSDAIRRFDDMIKYANGLIGTGKGRTLSHLPPQANGELYQFAVDPEVIRLRQAFVDAGTVATNPEQIRARLVDDLQTFVLKRIAEDAGHAPEIAEKLAKGGMVKGAELFRGLSSKSKGYMTAYLEDAIPEIIVGHPSTVTQAANFVPIMDWAAVRKAMNSAPMRDMATRNALTNPDTIMSVASNPQFQKMVAPVSEGGYELGSARNLRRFGRMETGVGQFGYQMVDLGDAIMRIFKKGVLLRLGYGVRNIAEGVLSTVASGLGMLEVMSRMDPVSLARNSLSNWKSFGVRNGTRWKTFYGSMNDEEALSAAWRQVEMNRNMKRDEFKQILSVVTDNNQLEELAARAANPNISEEARQAAEDSLRYLTAQKLKLEKELAEGQKVLDFADPDDPIVRVGQRLYHADSRAAINGVPDEYDDDILRVVEDALDGPLSTTPSHPVAVHNMGVDGFQYPFADGVAEGPQWATRRISGATNSAEAQFNEAMARIAEMRKTDGVKIEWRQRRGQGKWVPYTHRRKYLPNESENWEFRAVPKGGYPRVVAVDTWGAEADLRSAKTIDALMAKFTDLDRDILEAAAAGDRAAQNRVSEVLSKKGIYRAVFNDDKKWGGVNVLIHPKGVGNRGLAHAIDDEVGKRIKEAMKFALPDESAIPVPSRSTNKLNRGATLGRSVETERYTKITQILKNGGFEKIVDDSVKEQVRLLRQRDALETAMIDLADRISRGTKKRGIGPRKLVAPSRFSESGLTQDLPGVLEGEGGWAYRNYASADQTTGQTVSAQLYRSDRLNDLRTSAMKPRWFSPEDPDYWVGMKNLLGRMYRDAPGAQDMNKLRGGEYVADIDPIVWRALQDGDRERLFEDAVKWAMETPEGQDWLRTMDLATPTSGMWDDAIDAGRAEAAYRGKRPSASRKARRTKNPREIDWRESQSGKRFAGSPALKEDEQRVAAADVIERQFRFVEEHLLVDPEMKRQFLSGDFTAESLQAAYKENPRDLKGFNGLASPSTAESRQERIAHARARENKNILGGRINDLMDTGLRKVGTQPETRLLRHPVFVTVAEQDFYQRVAHGEAMMGRELSLTELQGLRNRAQEYALTQIKETLYTLESRSTMDDYLRFVSPFFPAWVNAASRWGKFYVRNPFNMGKIASRATTISAGSLIVDENGKPVKPGEDRTGFNTYLVVPFGVGNIPIPALETMINKLAPGAASVMNNTQIPLRSLDVVFQGNVGDPGFGPLVTIPTQLILTSRNEWAQEGLGKFISEMLMPVGPAATGNSLKDYAYQFLPSGVKQIWSEFFRDESWYAAYTRNIMVLSADAQAGEYSATPEQMHHDALKLTHFTQGVKIASAFVSPMAQQQRGDFEHYAGIYREMRDAAGGSTQEADKAFFNKYPAQFILTQGSTKNLTGGMATADTQGNQKNWGQIESLAALLDGPELLAFTDNYQDGGTLAAYDSEQYNPFSRRWQMYNQPTGFGENYRGKKTAEEVFRQNEEEKGWMKYSQIEAAVEGSLVAKGLRPGTSQFLGEKEEAMAKAALSVGDLYPIWNIARKQINTGKNERNALFFRKVISDPEWVRGKEDDLVVQSIDEYLNARDNVRAAMAQQGDALQSNAAANARWNAALAYKREQLSIASPSFREWVDRYFRNDIISVNDTTSLEAAS